MIRPCSLVLYYLLSHPAETSLAPVDNPISELAAVKRSSWRVINRISNILKHAKGGMNANDAYFERLRTLGERAARLRMQSAAFSLTDLKILLKLGEILYGERNTHDTNTSRPDQ